MANIEKALWAYLKDQPEIIDAVDNRIYTEKFPRHTDWPAICIVEVSDRPFYWGGVYFPRVQCSVVDTDSHRAKDVSSAVVSVVQRYCGTMDGVKISNITCGETQRIYEHLTRRYNYVTDLRIKHRD